MSEEEKQAQGVEETEQESKEEPKEEKKEQPFKAFSSKKEHDDYVEGLLKERLARKDKKAEEEKAEAERKAREDALKEQGKFKEIAEQHEQTIANKDQRIQELESQQVEQESLQERIEALEGRLKGLIKPNAERVPEMFREWFEEKSVEEQAAWLEKNAENLQGPQEPIGSPETPRAANGKNRTKEQDKEVAEQQRRQAFSAV